MGKTRRNKTDSKLKSKELREFIIWFFPALCILSMWGWIMFFRDLVSDFSLLLMLITAGLAFLVSLKKPSLIFNRKFMFIMLVFMLIGLGGWLSYFSGSFECKLYKCGWDMFCEKPSNMWIRTVTEDCKLATNTIYSCKTIKGGCLLIEKT